MTFQRSTALAAALGGVGLFFRLSVWQTTYDSTTRLIAEPALLLMFNLFFLVCGVVISLLLLRRWPEGAAASPPYSSPTAPVKGLRFAAAACFALGGILMLLELSGGEGISPVPAISAALLLLQGPVLLSLTLRRDTGGLSYATWLLLPCFVSCYLLVGLYHQVGAEPDTQVYLWTVISSLLACGAWVNLTGFSYQRQSGRLFALFAHLSLLALPVGIAAPLPGAWRAALAGQWLWLLACLLSLRAELPGISPARQEPEEEDDSGEEPEDLVDSGAEPEDLDDSDAEPEESFEDEEAPSPAQDFPQPPPRRLRRTDAGEPPAF